MRCPFCAHENSQVKDSRPTEDGSSIRRRRQCEDCGARFTTFERIQLRELTVVKSGDRREPFDRMKLERSIATACRKRPVPPERMERLASSIQRQIETSGESEMPSARIGEMVMEGLKALDPVAYIRFASVYKDFREAKDFEDFAGTVGESSGFLRLSPALRRRPSLCRPHRRPRYMHRPAPGRGDPGLYPEPPATDPRLVRPLPRPGSGIRSRAPDQGLERAPGRRRSSAATGTPSARSRRSRPAPVPGQARRPPSGRADRGGNVRPPARDRPRPPPARREYRQGGAGDAQFRADRPPARRARATAGPILRAGPAASGADVVLERARVFDSVAEAVADCAHVYATTVRKRGLVVPVVSPEEAGREVHDQ